MLEILVVFSIYFGLQKLLDNPIEKKIREAKTAEEAIEQRKRLKRFRSTFFIIYLIVYIVFSLWINFSVGEQDTNAVATSIKGLALGAVYMYQYLKQQKKYKVLMGNVSTFGKDDYLEQNEHFALFLRGFEEDDYSKENDLAKIKDLQKFSEYKFMNILQMRISACAIGMTKETDSPYGAKRVYVNDASWKQDVKELMEKADEIYILVNDRVSCIWEIEQSATMLNKTIFIIDDITKYENVRNKLNEANEQFLPVIPTDYIFGDHVILRFTNGNSFFEKFENNIDSYSQILRIPIAHVPAKQPLYKKKGCGTGYMIALTTFFVFIVVIVVIIRGCSNNRQQPEMLVEEIDHIGSTYISPFDKVRTVIDQVELPMDFGNGLTMVSINILEDMLKQYAKQNMLEAVKTGDIHSQELQFWLYCMNNGINLEYHYQSSSDANNRFAFTLTVDDLRNAFQRNSAYVSYD